MPFKGFECPKTGRGESLDFCFKKCKGHGSGECPPLPVLLSLSKQDRENEENIYHTTEILNPPQQVFLRRNNDYYIKPNSLIDSHVGSSWHEKLAETKKYVEELGLQDDYLMEKNFEVNFAHSNNGLFQFNYPDEPAPPIVILSGTSDLYVKSTKTLFDYKIMKYYYTFKYLFEGKWDDSTIPWQLNIYRVYQHPEAEEIKIFCYIKDFKLNMADKYDLSQTETLQVPMIPDDKVKERVVELLTEHVTAQKTGKPRPCTEEERWWNDRQKVYLRCEYYCAVKEICPQYAEEK